MRVLPGPTKSNQVLTWSPDGRTLAAAGSGDGVTVWDVDANTPGRRVLDSAHGGRLMRFCPRTGRLYVAFQSGGFWHWDPATGETHQHAWSVGYVSFYGLAMADDGREVAVNHYRNRPNGRRVVGYTVADDGTTTEAWSRPGARWADAITFRPGARQLFGLARHTDDTLRFEWVNAAKRGRTAGWFPVPVGAVTHWALSPDGERVAWVTEHALHVRHLGADTALELPAVDGQHRRGPAWSPDGRTLAYTTGRTVRLLDADTLAETRALDWGIGKPRAVAFNPDGLRAAVSGDGGRGWVTVFDLE